MSSLIVEVCEVKEIKGHPNADALEIAVVKGWDICVQVGLYQPGDRTIYIPPDSLLPRHLAQELGIEKYLSWSTRHKVNGKGEDHPEDLGRVRCANLRGVTSYGTLMRETEGREIGTDVAEEFGIQKWEPPVKVTPGDAEKDHPLFPKYYDMENARNFPEEIEPGEEVVATEKTHGMNCRIAAVLDDGEMVTMVGSHGYRRKLDNAGVFGLPLKLIPSLEEALHWYAAANEAKAVVLYGEVYGKGVQDLTYGEESVAFRAFDLMVDGQYVGYDEFAGFCHERGIPTMPLLYMGPFDFDKMVELSQGKTTLMENPGKRDIREGIVVKPVAERPGTLRSRAVLKFINPDYLTRKGGSEDH